ncbi:MAG: CoA transferase [Pseudodonghicola sp.]
MTQAKGPLHDVSVVEIGGGAGGAWCGRMLAELGAQVARFDTGDGFAEREEVPGDARTRGLLHAWLNDGKPALTAEALASAVAAADVLILGETAPEPDLPERPARVTVDLSWFGGSGPKARWQGCDLLVQALSGMVFPTGPVEGPPRQLGDLQSAMVGGATGVVAALAGLMAPGGPRHMEVSILEACMILGELQTADAQYLKRPAPRMGVNRFSPTCPVGIHRCKEGWLGLTVITPAQWVAFCDMLGIPELGRDPELATIYQRELRPDELEPIFDARLASRTAAEWAALARARKVPLIEVPDAGALLEHPVFTGRGAIRAVRCLGAGAHAPASPLHVAAPDGDRPMRRPGVAAEDPTAVLTGLRVADFSMGWAGPLATRILADLGAEVIKIEAGRYPDWWRSTQWTPEAIARRQYEESCRFSALNRGKKSVSFDLTTEAGRDLARRLVARSDAVIENHAAGVMQKLGMGWEELSAGRDDLVMVSMSAFGSGNALSDTRAYGSTLEQGAGLPSFRGQDGEPPVMGHVAYGDPIGGLYGAGAMLAALYHRQRSGRGQWLNLSHIETLLPFAGPAMLTRWATGAEPPRIGNRHVTLVPHGVFPGDGDRDWLAVAVGDVTAWHALARTIGRPEWCDGTLDRVAARRAREEEIEAALAAWSRGRPAAGAAETLQAQGVMAAPVLTPEAALDWDHHLARGFLHDTSRPHVGAQRQIGLALTMDGARIPLRGVAPFLGGDTQAVMTGLLGADAATYGALLDSGVISLQPTSLRGAG